jgi:V8-like Glu-specific endopeptidase
VEAGHLLETRYGRIAYNDIGTFSGTSGAPILNGITGEIAGVHIKGGALPVGGFNSGTAIGAIRAKSKALANL